MGSSSERAEETTMSLFLKVRDSYQGLASLMTATKNRNSWLTSRTTTSRTPSHCLSPQGGIPRPLKSAQKVLAQYNAPNWPDVKPDDGFNGHVAPYGVTIQQTSDISRAR